MPPFDATEIYPGLYQGSVPIRGRFLSERGFSAVVLAAREHQPGPERFPGLRTVISAPLDDAGYPPTAGEKQTAKMAATAVADIIRSGRRVLVTCHMGRNRSGLIVGLALADLLPDANRHYIVETIREARPGALSNKWFETMIVTAPRGRTHRSRWPRPYR